MFTDAEKKAFVEALKEALRVIVLAAIPVLIDGISSGSVNWVLVGSSMMIAGLRFIDKLLHEWGKAIDNTQLIKGITQF